MDINTGTISEREILIYAEENKEFYGLIIYINGCIIHKTQNVYIFHQIKDLTRAVDQLVGHYYTDKIKDDMFDFVIFCCHKPPSESPKKLTYKKIKRLSREGHAELTKITLFKDGLGFKTDNLEFARDALTGAELFQRLHRKMFICCQFSKAELKSYILKKGIKTRLKFRTKTGLLKKVMRYEIEKTLNSMEYGDSNE